MSAFGGKADMTFCENPLSRSLLGAKRTWLCALHMSASEPKRTCSDCGPMFRFRVKSRHQQWHDAALGSYEGGGYERRQDEG